MRKLLLSTAAMLLFAMPALAQPQGNRGEDHSNRGGQPNRVGKASVAPQVQDRAQAELRGQGRGQGGGDRGRGEERRGEIRANAPSQSAVLENRGDRRGDRNDRDRGTPAPQATIQAPEPSNRGDRGNWQGRGDRGPRVENRETRERLSSRDAARPDQRPDQRFDRNRSDWNRDGRTDYRRGGYGGPRRDFSGFRDYHRSFNAPRRFNVPSYRRPAGWYSHRWTFGEFLPAAFWARDYWIIDFEEYDLPPPPWGTVWVRVAGDALLIDEDSGEIITVAYNVFY